MKFFYVGFTVLVLVATASAFDLSAWIDKIKKTFTSDQLDEIRSKLRERSMKIRDALNQTRGRWLEMNETLFDVATEEMKINFRNESHRNNTKLKFRKNLEIAQNLTEKNKNAMFGITPFSFMDFDEFKNSYLMKPIPVEYLPINNATKFGSSRRKRAVTTNDLRTKGAVSAVRNQGNCGSCWSFATASTMETSYFKKYSKLYDLAEQQFVNCDTYDSGCNGGWMSNAYTYAKGQGIAMETTNAYKAVKSTCATPTGTLVKVSSYTQLAAKDVTSMMNAIDAGYSLAIALKAGTTTFMSYTGGILTNANDCTTTAVDHAVVVVGYGVANNIPYWIVRNSWGTSWGEQGYVRIQRGINYCNMETYPFFPIIV